MINTILRQCYVLKEKLGSGGFGETYLAEYPQKLSVPQRKCVVKLLKPNRKDDSDMVCRFKHEAEILTRLGDEHNQIPRYIDYFEENRDFYIVQEYIDGHDLTNEITSGEPWSEDEAIELLQGVLKVLAYVHEESVIHRDIKPSNIMRRDSDNKLILIDFGAAKEVISGRENISSTIEIGTWAYMPIEQMDGNPQLASDIYSLGRMAIQALTGLAVDRIPKHSWCEQVNVSKWLADILTKMVRYDFRHRYRDATEALNALKQTTAELEPLDNLPVPFQEAGKWGYETRTGEVVIQAHFNSAQKFSEGLARVELGYHFGYIDQTGKIVIDLNYLWGGKFCEGLARVRGNKTFGYINKQGSPINKQPLDGGLDFGEGVAPVMINNKWGYMDQHGEIVIEPQFDEAEKFDNGLARVRNGWESHTIDKAGKLID
ncbi:protein kinase domain-containing protein [Microcoleus sp. herbarium2]|uniref:protein kinase domain-containing protein n=1 Tax=Microcoleus sp. herbarium2 TaxID=3055433 RepID=UPI002FCF0863